LQALWPLQALVPPHFTPSACAAVANVPAAKIAAAVAMMVLLVMMCSQSMSHRWRCGRTTLRLVYAACPIIDQHAGSIFFEAFGRSGVDPSAGAAVHGGGPQCRRAPPVSRGARARPAGPRVSVWLKDLAVLDGALERAARLRPALTFAGVLAPAGIAR